MVSSKDTEIYRRAVKSHGRELSTEEREKLVEPYLPPPRESYSPAKNPPRRNGDRHVRKRRQKPIRSFLTSKLHILAYFVVHLIFGVYIRLRQTYHAIIDRLFALLYYHHRTPELIRKDVKNLSRLPEHLSVILTLKGEEDGGLETLMDDVAELSAWCASAGIPRLSVYEKSSMHFGTLRALPSRLMCRQTS
jgi:dehydrodolichyl diphosphate syntase complex subunit NUS1